ncbi:flagellin [Solimicrobium silvestre]|uniref:Flagellin n=1 Tax=Solimicrobium silvestre TaxID=2099400 RepID=A0A2S9GUS9_9BURK|nr:flagellin [Solimicrobium silvestre]PRC91487.1 Bacterial flagellin N-terminal helical region [Solimicrobium silvestre]
MLDAINTNIIALQTEDNLNKSQMSLSTSIQRLSSGLRINSATDDPAGLAIASRMSSQLSGLDQAAQNASTGISMLQTADGGLATTNSLLQSMRSLAVEAANGTNSTTDLASLQVQITQLQAELQQVSTTTQYNGINLIDGSLSNLQFQVGANAGQTISFGIGNAQQTALGNNVVSLTGGAGVAAGDAITEAGVVSSSVSAVNNVQLQTLTVQGNGTTQTISVAISSSAQSIATSINNLTSSTGITANATTTATLAFVTAGTQTFNIDGVGINASYSVSSGYSAAVNAINLQTGNTGVTASLTAAGITLSNTNGADIAVTNTGTNNLTLAGTVNTGTQAAPVFTAGAAVTLSSAASTTTTAVVGGNITFASQGGFAITTSVGTAATGGLFSVVTANGSTLNTVGSINLTTVSGNGTPTGANSALDIIDAAIAQINTSRASLGSLENRFTAAGSNLQTASLNLSSSLSTEQDTNFAAETTNLSRGQILQQAGTAMLAQANSLPNGVLALLR